MSRRNEAFVLLDEARESLERARDRVAEFISGHGEPSQNRRPPNRSVARSYADAADRFEVAIDALIEAMGWGVAPDYYVPPEVLNKMREARWNAFRWGHEEIPGMGWRWTYPRYRITEAEAKRRLANAGVQKRGKKYWLEGREIRFPGREIPTPLGSGLYGNLGLMEDEAGKPNLWFIAVSHNDIYGSRRQA